MESFNIKKFAELEKEREKKDTIEQLMEMEVEELSQVFINIVVEQFDITEKAHKLANRFDDLEVIYQYVREVFQDKFGFDVNQIAIDFIPEDEDD